MVIRQQLTGHGEEQVNIFVVSQQSVLDFIRLQLSYIGVNYQKVKKECCVRKYSAKTRKYLSLLLKEDISHSRALLSVLLIQSYCAAMDIVKHPRSSSSRDWLPSPHFRGITFNPYRHFFLNYIILSFSKSKSLILAFGEKL